MYRHSNSTYYNPNSPVLIDFPDYWSETEQLRRMYELRVRSICQLKYASDVQGHNVYFLTLTFSNKHMKYFTFLNKRVPVFDPDKLNRFFKNLRDHLLRYYNVKTINYMCCGEHGKTTNRPHYHALISCPKSVPVEEFYKILKKYWVYGFVYPNNPFGGLDRHNYYHRPILVNPDKIASAVSYCSKYILKNAKDPNKLYEDFKQKLVICSDADKILEFNRCQAKIKTSLGFGSAIEYYLHKDCENEKELYDRVYHGLNLDFVNVDSLTLLPKYTQLHLFYSNNLVSKEYKNIYRNGTLKTKLVYKYTRQRTQFYKDFRKSTFYKKITDDASNYKDDINHLLNDNDFINYVYFNHNIHDFEFLKGLNFYHLSIYNNVYRNRISPLHLYYFLNDPTRFENKTYESTVDRIDVVKNPYTGYIVAHKYQITNIVTLLSTFQAVEPLETCPFLRFDNSFSLPTGNENITQICDNAIDFDTLTYNLTDSPSQLYINNFPIQWNILFNSFPCFNGFDQILELIYMYRKFVHVNKDSKYYKTYIDSLEEKKIYEDLIEKLDYPD